MSSTALDRVLNLVDALAPDEQLRLIVYVAERIRLRREPGAARRKWAEISGAVSYPLMEEEAQAWVTRTRQEDSERRDQSLGRSP